MRTLEEIFGENEFKRTILFEDGGWCLYRRDHDRCYIIHRCAKVNKAIDPSEVRCHACLTDMPVALEGLFILNEWRK